MGAVTKSTAPGSSSPEEQKEGPARAGRSPSFVIIDDPLNLDFTPTRVKRLGSKAKLLNKHLGGDWKWIASGFHWWDLLSHRTVVRTGSGDEDNPGPTQYFLYWGPWDDPRSPELVNHVLNDQEPGFPIERPIDLRLELGIDHLEYATNEIEEIPF